jgi:hypothetical protein
MTVPAQNVAPQAVAAAGQTVFAFSWRCDDSALVVVFVNNVQDGGFTVFRNPDQTATPGGTITRGVACVGGEVVTVERLSPQTQTTALTRYGPFPADTITAMVDKFIMLSQEAASILGKTVKAARASLSKFSSLEMPDPEDGKMLSFLKDPISGLFSLAKSTSASVEFMQAYIQQVLSGGGVVQPLSWVFLGDDVNTDYVIAGALLASPDLYAVAIQGVLQEPTFSYTIDLTVNPAKIKFTGIVPLNARVVVRSLGYAKGVNVGDNSLVTATGGNAARKLADRFADWIDVKNYNAKGDDATDDTAAVAAAVTAANAANKPVYFPPGTYQVSNLTHGNTPWIGIPRRSIIKARNSGDAGYLVASQNWLNAGSTAASNPWQLVYGIDFDARGFKTHCVVLKTYFTRFENCRVQGATNTDLLISTDARDGTGLIGTMVNNEIVGCWLGVDGVTAQYNLRTIDTNGKATDYHVVGNYMSGASVANLRGEITSGWKIEGNHFYSAPSSAYIYKMNVGTRVVNNYFENEVRFGSPTGAASDAGVIGPGNYFAAHLWADFNNTGNYIVSHGNEYAATAEIRHSYFDPSKVVFSTGDTFRNATPFKHYAAAGGAVQDASTGKFFVKNGFLTPILRTVTVQFDGSGSASALLHRPASFDFPGYETWSVSTAKVYPPTPAMVLQTATAMYGGTGAPNNANGANGDIYFRSDGGALTTVYQRRAGAWVGIV